MLTTEQYRARVAFLRFQHYLDTLEHELQPLQPAMTEQCQFEFQTMSHLCRTFFERANQELFAVNPAVNRRTVNRRKEDNGTRERLHDRPERTPAS